MGIGIFDHLICPDETDITAKYDFHKKAAILFAHRGQILQGGRIILAENVSYCGLIRLRRGIIFGIGKCYL